MIVEFGRRRLPSIVDEDALLDGDGRLDGNARLDEDAGDFWRFGG